MVTQLGLVSNQHFPSFSYLQNQHHKHINCLVNIGSNLLYIVFAKQEQNTTVTTIFHFQLGFPTMHDVYYQVLRLPTILDYNLLNTSRKTFDMYVNCVGYASYGNSTLHPLS